MEELNRKELKYEFQDITTAKNKCRKNARV